MILGSRITSHCPHGDRVPSVSVPLSEAVIMNFLALRSLLCFRIKLGVLNGRCVDSTFPF